MKNRIFLLAIIIAALMASCKVKEVFVTNAPPVQPFFTDKTGLSYCSPPPIMLPLIKTISEIEISSQYFKIAVPLVLDKSGKAEAIKNLIDEQFVTALDKTKRFIVMDKGSMLNIAKQEYETGVYAERYDSTHRNISAIDQTVQYSTGAPIGSAGDLAQSRIGSNSVNTLTKVIDPKKNVSQFFGLYLIYRKRENRVHYG